MKKLIEIFLCILIIQTSNLSAQQWNGLTYVSNNGSTTGRLIDTNSVVVKTYTFSGGTGYSTHFLPGGDFFRSVVNSGNILTGGGMTGRIQKLDYNGTLLWDYTYSSSTYCLHHDICPLPNGNVLVISYDVYTNAQVVAAGGTFTGTTLQSEKIMELKPIGTNSAQVVWEWKVWDHLVQNTNSSAANYQTSIVNNPQLLNINYLPQKDWMHMNGIDYNPILDQIALSSHNLNEWYIIDHSTTTAEAASHNGGNAGKGGDILYRWGNPAAYQAAGSTILNVTHDSHWIPEGSPDAGYLAGINNKGVTVPSNKTCVDRIPVPRVDYNYTITPGSAFTPSIYSSRHQSTGYTSNMGSSNQFPNGNQMVCLAVGGTIYEIDPSGTVLWTYSSGGSCGQVHRYTTCYLTNPAPTQPSITLNSGVLNSTSATTYQWYVNGNLIPAATNQSYTPVQSGIYVVRTTDVNGCVNVYSAGFAFVNITTSIAKSTNDELNIYPNPSNGIFKISELKQPFELTVFNLLGQHVLTSNSNTFDLSNYYEGIYIVRIALENKEIITKKIQLTK